MYASIAGIVTFYYHFVLWRYVHDRNVKHHTVNNINLCNMLLKMIQIIIRTLPKQNVGRVFWETQYIKYF